MIQARLVKWLRLQLEEADGHISHEIKDVFKDAEARGKERDFLLLQLAQLSEDGSWWSDEEWEWFLNRCLDFLGAPK